MAPKIEEADADAENGKDYLATDLSEESKHINKIESIQTIKDEVGLSKYGEGLTI
jgi:hypothetical protein